VAREFAKPFYNSSAWKNKRREILKRDNYTCTNCDERATEVHHKIELTPKNINDIRIALGNDNLVSLCHDCHKKITLNRSDVKEGFIFDEHGQVVPRGIK
jgi:5-methylcytosine-specific restriction endonuclease McrA